MMKHKIVKPIIIAEIGCNHKGDFKIAKEMIAKAKECGAEYVKFQKRNNRLLLGDKYDQPHPVPENSYGDSYGKHRDFLEFDIKQHLKLKKYCKKIGIGYSISVWDVISAKEVIDHLNLDYVKIPSACNLNYDIHQILAKKFKKKIHISTGMTSFKEINDIYKFYKKFKRQKDLVIYSCTSDYPVKSSDVCLLEISRLKKKYRDIDSIAFSGHHLGIAIDLGALMLGAKYIERHFTLDRTWKGTDHAASLEPSGLDKLCRDIKNVHSSLKYKTGNGIIATEKLQRKKLKDIKI